MGVRLGLFFGVFMSWRVLWKWIMGILFGIFGSIGERILSVGFVCVWIFFVILVSIFCNSVRILWWLLMNLNLMFRDVYLERCWIVL